MHTFLQLRHKEKAVLEQFLDLLVLISVDNYNTTRMNAENLVCMQECMVYAWMCARMCTCA